MMQGFSLEGIVEIVEKGIERYVQMPAGGGVKLFPPAG
jgi:hypothetical protein